MTRVDEITTPEDAVFDGVGIAVCRKKATTHSMTLRWFHERQAGKPYQILPQLAKNEPKVAILNYRYNRLLREERAFIRDHFVEDWGNVMVVGRAIDHPGGDQEVTFTLLSTTKYAIKATDLSKVTIDGKTPRRTEVFEKGTHRISVSGNPQKVLIKYFPAVAKARSSDPGQNPRMFASYRD